MSLLPGAWTPGAVPTRWKAPLPTGRGPPRWVSVWGPAWPPAPSPDSGHSRGGLPTPLPRPQSWSRDCAGEGAQHQGLPGAMLSRPPTLVLVRTLLCADVKPHTADPGLKPRCGPRAGGCAHPPRGPSHLALDPKPGVQVCRDSAHFLGKGDPCPYFLCLTWEGGEGVPPSGSWSPGRGRALRAAPHSRTHWWGRVQTRAGPPSCLWI